MKLDAMLPIAAPAPAGSMTQNNAQEDHDHDFHAMNQTGGDVDTPKNSDDVVK